MRGRSTHAGARIPHGGSTPPPLIDFRWNPALSDTTTATVTLTEANALGSIFEPGDGQSGAVRTLPPIAGKTYAEIQVVSLTGVGDGAVGLCDITRVAQDAGGWFVGGTALSYVAQGRSNGCGNSVGLYSNGGSIANGAYAFGNGDVIGIAFNAATRSLWFRKNGGAWLSGGDPALGTSPSLALPAGSYQFYAGYYSCNSAPSTGAYRIRVADAEFSSAPPVGFSSYSGA